MEPNLILIEIALVVGMFFLFALALIVFRMVRKQINDQIKEIIPIQFIRKSVSIKIKWK